MISIKPVIAICLFRRPSYTRILFAALEKCYGFSEIPCVINCDYSKEHEEKCAEVAKLALDFASRHPNVTVYTHGENQGVDLSKLFIIPRAFSLGDYCIFLECDTGLAADSLNYFIAMGEKYKDDQSIASISGYNRIEPEEWSRVLLRGESVYYETERKTGFCPWGFAVHKDRWDSLFANGAERYLRETGDQANGLFDHNWNGLGLGYYSPGRCTHKPYRRDRRDPYSERRVFVCERILQVWRMVVGFAG